VASGGPRANPHGSVDEGEHCSRHAFACCATTGTLSPWALDPTTESLRKRTLSGSRLAKFAALR
jgi:hypothetical protein